MDVPDKLHTDPALPDRESAFCVLTTAEKEVASVIRDLDCDARIVLNVLEEAPDGSTTTEQFTFVNMYDLPSNLRPGEAYNAAKSYYVSRKANLGVQTDLRKPPRNFKEAMQRPDKERWMEAWCKECQQLDDCWYWCDCPHNAKPCQTLAVFTIKLLPSGEVDRYKVRLCLDGSRMDREEMGETFQAVSTMACVNTLVCIANQEDMDIIQNDVEGAFLVGTMPYELYAYPPRGIQAPRGPDGRRQVRRVTGNWYGHPKAPFIYGGLFHDHLLGFGKSPQQQDDDGKVTPSDCHDRAFSHGSTCTVTQGRADTCMYTVARKCNRTGKCASFRIVVYVDDTASAVPRTVDDRQLFHDFCAHVNSKFKFQADADGNRRGKPIDVFLGVEYTRDELKGTLS